MFVHCLCRLDFRRSLVSGLTPPPPPPRGEERGLFSRTAAGKRGYCLCFYHGKSWETISQQKGTCLVITLLQSFISKICLINHHHASFTYREIGCCVFTRQSSRFLAHVSVASQPLNLKPPPPPPPSIAFPGPR